MDARTRSIVGDAHASTRAWEVLEDLVEIETRMPGQAGEGEAAEVLAGAFEDAGAREVGVESFSMPGWWRGTASLEVDRPERSPRRFDAAHEVVALPGSPAGSPEAAVVDLGYGLPPDLEGADLEGKLALVAAAEGDPADYHRSLHRTEKYARVEAAGAAGFLFHGGPEGCLPPTGFVRLERPDALPGSIPAVGVSRELGARLVRYADAGPVEGRLDVDCENRPTESRNVEAVLGPGTGPELLVTAHLDAHDLGEGARDNGSGCALVAETARLLAPVEDDLETRVRFVAFGAEEAGFLGAHHWAEGHDLDGVRGVLNLDGIGGSRTLHARTHGFPALGEAFRRAGRELDVPVRVDDGMSPFADQWAFVQRGVPGASVRSVSGAHDRRWGLGRLWSHTHGDTLDKLDPRDLRDLAATIATGVASLATAGPLPDRQSPAEVANRVPAAVEEEMRTTGRWPFGDG